MRANTQQNTQSDREIFIYEYGSSDHQFNPTRSIILFVRGWPTVCEEKGTYPKPQKVKPKPRVTELRAIQPRTRNLL